MSTIHKEENVFFTSDHHFHHANIIKYTSRPFSSVEEMNETLVQNWNATVGRNDTVYHLGDFSLSRDVGEVKSVMSRLNGNITLLCLPWHHDGGWLTKLSEVILSANGKFVNMEPALFVIKVPWMKKEGFPLSITLSHYPMAEWEASHYGAWLLHGHSHGSWYDSQNRNAIDVGVDSWGYSPVPFESIVSRMHRISYKGVFSDGG